ncbi:M16 family metallopeptidase [Rubrivirga litoralis]|uniref:Insulinase family protein n=1 Tax=Rubrivirga litoralis TaxID=3075598 RepID=A0ABU3BMB4_9BACT|nr:insulinase family protein [Rubrivirga sp. F394]MDT0630366.1 insulinase family protein [Rubrivirga sp. F394]
MIRPLLAALVFVGAGCATTQTAPPEATRPERPPAADVPETTGGAAATPLPLDPAVRTGRLANGLTYYVRENREPRDRAELRLVVDAGSVLEDEDQRGLAHLLEHMAFNGTEAFPEQELVRYLESTGMQFGPDVNAYTSFDETVYMLQVPTDSADTFETGLEVLREWAGSVTITPEEVAKEKGVVLEELRLGRGAGGRVRDVQFPVIFQGSRYAERLPIGDEETLQAATAERLRDFYDDYYRPDLMAVVVVGDVDADRVAGMIEDQFGDLDTPADAPPRPSFSVPGHDETLVVIATDPELPQGQVQVLLKREPETTRTEADYRRSVVVSLFNAMLNARLGELRQSADPPFAFAGASLGGGLRTVDFASFFAVAPGAGALRALEALLTEAERVRRFGFTEGELERAKAEVLNGLDRALAERDQTPSRAYASALVDYDLEGAPALGVDDRNRLTRRVLPGVTLDEVTALASELLEEENRVVALALPETEGGAAPTEAEVRATLAAVEAADLAPYDDAVAAGPLVPTPPSPGRVVEADDLGNGVTRWTLSNGVRVLLKPTDFQNDEVLISATSPGGTSLFSLDTYRATQFAAAVVGSSGAGTFSAPELQKKLAGQTVSVLPTLSEREEGIRGQASPDDLETALQLVYLTMTAPRRDEDAFGSTLGQIRTFLDNAAATPQKAFSDTLNVTLTGDHPRRQPLTLAALDAADLDASVAAVRERFADADDFTFSLVGAFEPSEVQPLVETWLGGLPTLPRTDVPQDVLVDRPDGVVRKTVYRGVEPQARVQVVFHGLLNAYSDEAKAELEALAQILETTLRETLREDLGGTYSVRVQGGADREPRPEYTVSLGFGADPARVDELVDAVFADIAALKADGPEDRLVQNVREGARREQQTALRQNGYWLSVLGQVARYGLPVDEVLARPALLEATTEATVQEATRRYLDTDRYVQVVLLPEILGDGGATAE